MYRLLIGLLVTACCAGCLPRTIIKANPGPKDRGIRYYRPKPYLFVKPMVAKDGQAVPGMVHLEMTTLPDYSEEYSIHIRSGLGINDTSVTLEDGWNLTQLNVKVDSQTNENLSAVSDLIGVVPDLTKGSNPGQAMSCKATNVPMGLYEAVVSRDVHGIKRLYGFRYIGFLPYASCPTSMHGHACESCQTDQLYGLVFENGVMVFRQMFDLPNHLDCPPTASPVEELTVPVATSVDDGFDP